MEIFETLKSNIKKKNFLEACEYVVKTLYENIPHYNWVGIYLLSEEGEELTLGPWAGPQPTEHVRIPVGYGICGLAVREKQTVIVNDVSKEPRYLACFPSTRSEIVVPIITKDGKIIGEIDIDSDKPAAFGEDDRRFLEKIARILSETWEKSTQTHEGSKPSV